MGSLPQVDLQGLLEAVDGGNFAPGRAVEDVGDGLLVHIGCVGDRPRRLALTGGFEPSCDLFDEGCLGRGTFGNNLTKRVGLLQRESPEIRDGPSGADLSPDAQTRSRRRLYDLGINPIVGTTLTNKGEPPTEVLQDQRFECRDGTIRRSDVRGLHTTACVDYVDGDGYLTHQPLRRLGTLIRNNSDGTCRWYNRFEVPANPLLADLPGAKVNVRINSTKHDREPGPPKRRTNALRALNPTDECYRGLTGAREHRVRLLRDQDPAALPPSLQHHQPPRHPRPSRTHRLHHSQSSHTPLLRNRHRSRPVVRSTPSYRPRTAHSHTATRLHSLNGCC